MCRAWSCLSLQTHKDKHQSKLFSVSSQLTSALRQPRKDTEIKYTFS